MVFKRQTPADLVCVCMCSLYTTLGFYCFKAGFIGLHLVLLVFRAVFEDECIL